MNASEVLEGARVVRMSYDAAQTTIQNENHWAAADHLSADAANSEHVRKTLRERARYEVGANSYAAGIVDTKANDVIGRGPRLQIRTGNDDVDNEIEAKFTVWASKQKLALKLRLMRKARMVTGEAFLLFANGAPLLANPFDTSIKPTSVQLTLRLIEADQVATPGMFVDEQSGQVSGIVFDKYGTPTHYHILKEHPGDANASSYSKDDKTTVPAKDIVHYFKPDRPGQSRGIPELTPGLPLLAQMRRWTASTLTASENLANIAFTIETNAPPDSDPDNNASPNAMEIIPVERGEALVMPEGWGLKQPKAEQPVSTYAEFKHELLTEFARCINMPRNIAAGDSSDYNYASGRLDHQMYSKANRIDQDDCEGDIVNPILDRWSSEAVKLKRYLSVDARKALLGGEFKHQWFWDGVEHVDPLKEANAQKTRLESKTTTLAEECARTGKDWKDVLLQQRAEQVFMEEIGLVPNATPPEPPTDDDGENEGDEPKNGKKKTNADA